MTIVDDLNRTEIQRKYIDHLIGKIVITGKHKDHRGKITKMIKLPNIYKPKKPDTEFFLNL